MSSVQFSHSVMSDSLRPHESAALQASLSITNSWSLLRLMSIESVMPSSYLILCCPLLPPSIFPSIRVFSNASALHIRCPKYWCFSSFTHMTLNIFCIVLTPTFICVARISPQCPSLSKLFPNVFARSRRNIPNVTLLKTELFISPPQYILSWVTLVSVRATAIYSVVQARNWRHSLESSLSFATHIQAVSMSCLFYFLNRPQICRLLSLLSPL